MSTLHLVDPELRPLLAQFPAVGLSADNLAEVRRQERERADGVSADDALLEAVAMFAPFHCPLVQALDCVLVPVEYRLAAETRYPHNVEDCCTARSRDAAGGPT